MTKETHDLIYNSTLENMDDKKSAYFDGLLSCSWSTKIIISFIGILSFFPTLTAIVLNPLYILLNLPILTGLVPIILLNNYEEFNLTKKEYKMLKKSGELKRIAELLKEYKNIKKSNLEQSQTENVNIKTELYKLNIAENNLQIAKNEKLDKIKQIQSEINEIETNLSKTKTQKENLIKQLSTQKTTEKAERTKAWQTEENNTNENLNNIVQDGNIIEKNINKNL